MSESKYYVISNSDGDTFVKVMSKSELESMLNEDGGGYYNVNPNISDDTNYWRENELLVIKGEAISAGQEVRYFLED